MDYVISTGFQLVGVCSPQLKYTNIRKFVR